MGNGGKGRKEGGDTGEARGTGEFSDFKRGRALDDDGNYLEKRVFGEGWFDSWGRCYPLSFRFQKHAIAWCARCFLKDWNRRDALICSF